MTIRYKIRRSKLGGEEKAYPKVVTGETATVEQFQDKVAKRAARGLADALAVLTAQREVFLEELLDEQSVHVPGIGYFTLAIKGKLDENERLVTKTVKMKVNFRPERKLSDNVNRDNRFEFVGE